MNSIIYRDDLFSDASCTMEWLLTETPMFNWISRHDVTRRNSLLHGWHLEPHSLNAVGRRRGAARRGAPWHDPTGRPSSSVLPRCAALKGCLVRWCLRLCLELDAFWVATETAAWVITWKGHDITRSYSNKGLFGKTHWSHVWLEIPQTQSEARDKYSPLKMRLHRN